MERDNVHQSELFIRKYLFWIIALILLALSFFILKAYLIALVSAFVLAYLVLPVYKKINTVMNKHLAAALCILLVALVVLLPIFFVIAQLLEQVGPKISATSVEAISQQIAQTPLQQYLDIDQLIERGSSLLIAFITKTLALIPSLILSVFVTLFAMYYILISWDTLARDVRKYIPFKDKDRIAHEIAQTTNNIVYGYFLIALIEFVIALTGFSIGGVRYSAVFASLIALFAFLPGLGPFLVWGPLTVAYFLAGSYPAAIAILITGLVISIGIDTLLAFKIVGTRARINPLLLMLGILGGVPVFGIFGFIIGPLVLVYTFKLLKQGITHKKEVLS